MRSTLAAIALICALAVPAASRAGSIEALYQARTIVTGTREPERLVGFGHCLEDVLVKVSGNLRLADDPRAAPMKQEAAHFIAAYRYHDRMEGIPHHDEQGSRDRPYDLFCTFNRAGVDALLASLKQKPWLARRPTLAVFLGVHQVARTFVLARDGDQSRDMRESMAAAADKRGMAVVLPDTAAIAADRLTLKRLAGGTPLHLEAAARAAGGDVPLTGTLIWNEHKFGWVADWRLPWHGRVWRWRISGVNFDSAFRSGVGGALSIISGHGPPRG